MRRRTLAWNLRAVMAFVAAFAAVSPAGATDAFSIDAEVSRLGEQSFWPDFDPRRIPLAVYDGEYTYLFRHRNPPDGFEPVDGNPRTARFPGRHAAVTANSSADIGGRITATLTSEAASGAVRNAAAVAIHEAFHVYQRENFPAWQANEFDLLIYPFDDLEALTLRRLETLALQRALREPTAGGQACWGEVVRETRRERFRGMPSKAVAYERASELNEGLARYVQGRAEGLGADLETSFSPEDVRRRTYWTGQALAQILDRLSRSWKTILMEDDDQSLDSLLADAVSGIRGERTCTFSNAERKAARTESEADLLSLESRRDQLRAELVQADGWALVLEAPDEALMPQGFDPLNIQVLRDGELLHQRYLKLGNDSGSLEILGRSALTSSAGKHPLGQGVRTLTVPAIASEPQIRQDGDAVLLEGEGISGKFSPARLRKSGERIVVRLGTTAPKVAPPTPPAPKAKAPPLGAPSS